MMRLNRTAWLDEGFNILKTLGAANLKIEILARNLEKTKGSFYHHFKNRDDFSQKLLEEWEKRQTLEVIKISNQETCFKKISLQPEKAYEPEVEVAIRAWALRDPIARAFQERIDKRRVAFLKEMFARITVDTNKINTMSLIRYCFYIGSQQIIPTIEPDNHTTLMDSLMEIFDLYVNKTKKGN